MRTFKIAPTFNPLKTVFPHQNVEALARDPTDDPRVPGVARLEGGHED